MGLISSCFCLVRYPVDSQSQRIVIQSCILEAALARGDLADEEWQIIEKLLPAERGRKSRPFYDNRRFMNGMLHVLRVGCPWRDMHERYGKWNSVYVRFRRWADLVELGAH
uniref:transposase n=1 Tax=Mesorhizobium zhangyense TaxID=1776730 RepID=UPI0035E4571D